MVYTLSENENENYWDFVQRSLKGQISEDDLQILLFLLEIIFTEITVPHFAISLTVKTEEIGIYIVHHGKAIKNKNVENVKNQVDNLRYRHLTKDSHVLEIKKKINMNTEG